MKRILLYVGLSLLPLLTNAGTAIENTVVYAGVNSNDLVFVQFNKSLDEPGCNGKQLVLPKNSPIDDKVLSIALTAKTTKSTVMIKPKGCEAGSPSLHENTSDWGFFYIK